MKTLGIFVILVIGGTLTFFLFNSSKKETRVSENNVLPKSSTKSNMKITSSVFQNSSKIPFKYTCDGENVNPPLEFVDVPSSAKSLVLIVDDPDAPAGTFTHWVLYNMKPDVGGINEANLPGNVLAGKNSAGSTIYFGPCPPSGTHRYFFKLYAIDSALDLPQNANKQIVEEKMEGHIIDKAELIGLYSRE